MATPTFETLTVDGDEPVGRLTLDRPDKLNPLSWTTLREIADAARWFDTQTHVKVVVVSGAGRAFSAGSDLSGFSGEPEVTQREGAELGRLMAESLERMNALTIAGIRGWCVGGGVVLASACDIRVAAEGTRFSIPEVDLGIPLTWGGVPRLVRAIGPAMTTELVITCRPFDAAEAKQIGFVNRVVSDDDLDAEVDELAELCASKSAHSLISTKRNVQAIAEQMVGTSHSWQDADGIVSAYRDEESREVGRRYLERLAERRRG